jgi:hypothetical protein
MNRDLSLVAGHITASLAPVRHASHSQTRRGLAPGHLAAGEPRTATAAIPPRRRPSGGCEQRAVRTSQRAASRTHVAVQPKAGRR